MFIIHAAGWKATDWRNTMASKVMKTDINHVTVRIEGLAIMQDPIHITWGKRGLEFFAQPVLERAWGSPELQLLGHVDNIDYTPPVKYSPSLDLTNLIWGIIGAPKWWRPDNCATVSRGIVQDLGLDWTPAETRWAIA